MLPYLKSFKSIAKFLHAAGRWPEHHLGALAVSPYLPSNDGARNAIFR